MPTTHEPHVISPIGMQKRAPFVVIEGLDRSGKTTQISLLHSRLELMGIRTRLLKFPGMRLSYHCAQILILMSLFSLA